MKVIAAPATLTHDPLDIVAACASYDELAEAGLSIDDINLVWRLPAWDWPAGLYLRLAEHFGLLPATDPLEL
jgi:hypothetical protein